MTGGLLPRFRLSTLPATNAEELCLELRFVVPRTKLNVVSPRLSTPASYSTHARNFGTRARMYGDHCVDSLFLLAGLHSQLDRIGTPSEQKNPLVRPPRLHT
jgi:hypothetical protein